MAEENKTEYVVVYGTLMNGERNARWAGDAKRKEVLVDGEIFDTGWGFPAFVPNPIDASRIKPVAAELLETDEEGIRRMDVLEGYPRLYDRVRVSVYPKDGDYRGEPLPGAWVYVMNRIPEHAKRIKPTKNGGIADWREYRKAEGM